MLAMIVSLTACVFLCGFIAYLHWFFSPTPATDLAPPSEATALAQSGSASLALSWYRRLLTFAAGTFMAGFAFVLNLSGYLSPDKRPLTPNAALGYTHFFRPKYGGVFGTYFECLAITYGPWVTWGGFLLTGLIAIKLKITLEGSRAYPLLFFAGSATSMAACFALWQISLYAARS